MSLLLYLAWFAVYPNPLSQLLHMRVTATPYIFSFKQNILPNICNKEKNELKRISNTKFVNSGLSSNDVVYLDHLDASCEIDPYDLWCDI